MPQWSVCSVPGCPTYVERGQGRCDEHRRQRDRQRGSRQTRGYDVAHDRERAWWAPKVATGKVACWRCGKPIDGAEPWDLGHDDHDRSIYRGPEHVACNRATAGRRR